jgi:diguanylate cyclase (GGDEF)-like protein
MTSSWLRGGTFEPPWPGAGWGANRTTWLAAVLAGWVLSALLVPGPAVAAAASTPVARSGPNDTSPAAAQALYRQAAAWEDEGFDEPDAVLERLAKTHRPDDVRQALWDRIVERTRGVVAARAGKGPLAIRAADRLARMAEEGHPRARADEWEVRALVDDQGWRTEPAVQQARAAEDAFAAVCAERPVVADCDPRAWWRMLRLLAVRAETQGHLVEARQLQQRGLDAAVLAADGRLQAWTLASLAVISQSLGEPDLARRQMAQAERTAQREAGTEALLRVRNNEARLADLRGDVETTRRALEEAMRLAEPLHSPRLEAQILANLSDAWLRTGRPREALDAANRALPVVRRFGDARSEPQLLHNGGLARLALGQLRSARTDLDAALALWQGSGAHGPLRAALRQYADALAAAGDPRAALEMYHRETRLREQLEQSNRDAMLQELRQRYRTEADQRDLAQLGRENALKATLLDSQRLTQRIWALGGAFVVLALVALGLLVKRTRDANQQLRHGQALLQVQSRRDALTGLANRRHFREVLSEMAGEFSGALLLLDVDHFKRINDEEGHLAGDAVLADVALRLAATVRAGDLVCRWGGEEFLIFAPGLHGEGLDAMARRLLHVVGDSPVPLPDGRSLDVTLSAGYGHFPLPEQHLAMGWERAVNLADMALYTAKSLGRDTTVGLLSARASTAADLTALEAGFERARHDGRVTLKVQHRSVGLAAQAAI